MTAQLSIRTARGVTDLALRVLTAAALTVEAVIHLQLGAGYQAADPAGVGQGNLFRIQAVLALLVALGVLVLGNRTAYAAAALTAAGALGAVLLSRYVEVPAIGPIPSMYEPLWFFKKVVTAVAEAVATATALTGFFRGKQSAPATVTNR